MRNLLYIAVFTAAIVISWIVFGVYHNTATSTIEPNKKIIITPIPAKFDSDIVKKILQRKVIEADLSKDRTQGTTIPSPSLESSPRPSPPVSSSESSTPSAGL